MVAASMATTGEPGNSVTGIVLVAFRPRRRIIPKLAPPGKPMAADSCGGTCNARLGLPHDGSASSDADDAAAQCLSSLCEIGDSISVDLLGCRSFARRITKSNQKESPLRIVRRLFGGAATLLALAGIMLGALALGFVLVDPALAQAPTNEELMLPGPLGEHVEGRADAPVTLIEYASVTCTHCAHFYTQEFPTLKARYIDTGKVRFIFREFARDPLDLAGFMLARCLGGDKFFPFVELLFQKQNEWVFVPQPLPPLTALAKQAGFTQDTFEACLGNQKIEDGIRSVRDRATEKLGVEVTPTFFINGRLLRGAPTMEELGKMIDDLLKS
jgi:protein-disulfide isomerase